MKMSILTVLLGAVALFDSYCSRGHSRFLRGDAVRGALEKWAWADEEYNHFLIDRFLGVFMILLGLWGIFSKEGS